MIVILDEFHQASKPSRNVVLEPLQDVQGTELLHKVISKFVSPLVVYCYPQQLAELQRDNERLQGKLREAEQAAIVAIRDKELTVAKHKESHDDKQVTQISKLKQHISELQVQLENSSSNKGGVADQGGGANDELREKLISTTVSGEMVH